MTKVKSERQQLAEHRRYLREMCEADRAARHIETWTSYDYLAGGLLDDDGPCVMYSYGLDRSRITACHWLVPLSFD